MKLMIALLALLTSLSGFALETGAPAPDFTLKSAGTKDGEIKLSNFKGKVVVLEWLNHGCPFVRKHYDSGNMQNLQKKYVSKNVIWLSVISSAPGKQGYVTADEARKDVVTNKSGATNILLDPTGKVGQLYEAKTTPHMFIINKEGILAYQGAIDDKPDTDKESVKSAKNYVSEALDLIFADKKVTQATTKAYGCGVKYQ
ncbi:MAG: redoxin family protein [Bdellovibrionales bacterium]|nr:redoxin family protein [Bdellovibrionales bacterium]